VAVTARFIRSGEIEAPASLAMEGIPAGVLVLDAAGKTLYASSPLARILGGEVRSLEEKVEESGDFPRREVFAVLLQACEVWAGVSRLVTLDRQHRHYFYVSATPRLDSAGEKRMVALVMDLTEMVMQGDIAAEFVRQVRHDLRGPLTSMRGAADLLLTERLGRLDERQKRLLGLMVKGTENMTTIVSGASGAQSAEPEDRRAGKE